MSHGHKLFTMGELNLIFKNKQTGEVRDYTNNPFMSSLFYEYEDKRIWEIVKPGSNLPVVRIETIYCKLFNSFFGFNLMRHAVYELGDLEGYYV